MASRPIVLVTDEAKIVSAVSAALSSNGHLNNGDVLRDLPGMVARLERGAVPAVLVDIDALPARGLGSLESIVRRFPETRFVLLATELAPDVLLQAMQIGARYCLLKKNIPAELTPAIHRLCPTNHDGERGKIITIFSAGGGCGATTLAVNLANELRREESDRSLIVDLDYAYATVPSFLGLQGQFGVLELLSRSGPVDSELIATTALVSSPTLHVLPTTATNRLPSGTLARSVRIEEVLAACKSVYSYTVIDAPRVSPGVMADLARLSDVILVVLQLTIKDLRVAKLILQDLLDQGISNQLLVPIIGRYRRRIMAIEPEQAERVLSRDSLVYLNNDFPSASQAITSGQPLAQVAPHSTLRREIRDLASSLLRTHLMPSLSVAQGR